MYKRIFVLLICVLFLFSCESKVVQRSDGLWYKENELFTGIDNVYYSSGQKKVEATFKDGEKDGLWTFWHENGQKEREGTCKVGKEVGKWTFYNEDGTVKEVKDFGDG